MKKIIPFVAVIMIATACKKDSVPVPVTDKSLTSAFVTDINEPVKYVSTKIGTQNWMTTNLTVSRYRNEDRIPQIKDASKWDTLTTGAWCWYNNDSATGAAYGKLYNWYAVHDPRGLAPTGWHVASDAEWDTLKMFLGNNAGGKLKAKGTIEAGTGLWYAPNTAASNKTGFTALPAGYRNYDGSFTGIGYDDSWWSSTALEPDDAWDRFVEYNDGSIGRTYSGKTAGFSVRCLRD